MDFETTPSFNLTVQVSDDGAPILSDSGTVTIDLNDLHDPPNQAPVVNDQSLPPIDENSPSGTVLGAVVANDPDWNNLSYTITAGNVDGAFAINASSGQISVANQTAVNFETTPRFNLIVQVSDDGEPILSDTATITIDLNDVSEPLLVKHTPHLQLGNAPLIGYANSEFDQVEIIWQTIGTKSDDSFTVEYRPAIPSEPWTQLSNPIAQLVTGVQDRVNHSVAIDGLGFATTV